MKNAFQLAVTLALFTFAARLACGGPPASTDGYLYVTAQNENQFGILKINDRRVLETGEKSH